MAFGFFGKHQAVLEINTPGRSFTSAGRRDLSSGVVGWHSSALLHLIYLPSNTGAEPDMQNLVGTAVPYNGSFRARIGSAEAVASVPRYYYNSVDSLTPTRRDLRVVYHDSDKIRLFGAGPTSWIGSGSGSGGIFADELVIPYFRNLEAFIISNGNSGYALLTSIKGKFPDKRLNEITIFQGGTSIFINSIEHPFPATVEYVTLGVASSGIGNDVNRLIAECVNAKHLIFSQDSLSDSGVSTQRRTPITGALDISHIKGWKRLAVDNASGMTDILYDLDDPNIELLRLNACNGISGTTLGNLCDTFFNSNAGQGIIITACQKTITRDIVDDDIKPTVSMINIGRNTIIGSIDITTPKPNLGVFVVGDDTADTEHSTISYCDVSGLTHATRIGLSSCDIEYLKLPTNTVCTNLNLGANKLDIVEQPDLIDQITAMTALSELRLNTGASGRFDNNHGQNSPNGLGPDADFSPLTSLTLLLANGCKLSGTLKVPSSVQGIYVRNNSLSAIDGNLNSVTALHISDNGMSFDFSRIPNIVNLLVSNESALTEVDLSGRTSTTSFGTLSINNNLYLEKVVFPTSGKATMGNVSVTIANNPLLSEIENQENIVYTQATSGTRNFNAAACSLDVDFKFGTNSFTPAAITIQNNGMSVANVDATITGIYTNRTKWDGITLNRTMNIGGSNAPPSGIYQAPDGFVLGVSDGTPASPKEMIYVLVNNYGWSITFNNIFVPVEEPIIVQSRYIEATGSSEVFSFVNPPAEGNVIVIIAVAAAQVRDTTISGFTREFHRTSTTPFNNTHSIFWKVAGGSESNNYTVSFGNSTNIRLIGYEVENLNKLSAGPIALAVSSSGSASTSKSSPGTPRKIYDKSFAISVISLESGSAGWGFSNSFTMRRPTTNAINTNTGWAERQYTSTEEDQSTTASWTTTRAIFETFILFAS